jgi:transcriptional regulator with XRE-family HTH domain
MRMAHSSGVVPLGQLLKKERQRRNLSQDEAAKHFGRPQATYGRWENVHTTPEPDRELHTKLRAFVGLDERAYAQSLLEHGLRVRERNQ